MGSSTEEKDRVLEKLDLVEWNKVDMVKLRRRIEDRLRKDKIAVRLTAILLNVDLPMQGD